MNQDGMFDLVFYYNRKIYTIYNKHHRKDISKKVDDEG
jgi:hypothetical protein